MVNNYMKSNNLWKEVETGPNPPEEIFVLIEIPKGSRVKYRYLRDKGYMVMDRVLFSPVFYVGNYGIIPKTMWDNGEPLDALIIMNEPIHPGTIIAVKPIAILEMLDEGKRDDKILAIASGDPSSKNIKDLHDLNPHLPQEIAHFFESYKHLEGKKVEILGWKGIEGAKKAIVHAQKLFNAKVK